MNISKRLVNVYGYVEYRYTHENKVEDYSGIVGDRNYLYESDSFNTLEELLKKLKVETLEKLKEDLGAEELWVTGIVFKGKSECGETSGMVSMYENGFTKGYVDAKLQGSDVDSEIMGSLKRIKQEVDRIVTED